VTAPAVIGLAL